MEYADVVWDNCTSGNSDLLESVQYDAAKIITGAIKGTSARKLREELAWVKLQTKRKIHKIIFFHKSVNRMTPAYISDLVPLRVGERSNICLRSATEFSTFQCRTEMFKTSFFPSVINLWNNLSLDIRQLDSSSVFKHTLNNLLHPLKYNRFFDSSLSRRASILHARLRLGCCALNDYLFFIHCAVSPICACKQGKETVKHYLLECPRYATQRATLLTSAAQLFGQSWLRCSDTVKLIKLCFKWI
jgi:hypothetical protein